MRRIAIFCVMAVAGCLVVLAAKDIKEMKWSHVVKNMPKEWYASPQARAIADTVIKYQCPNGGWPKNNNFHKEVKRDEMAEIRQTGIGATIDNNATMLEMRFLAKVYANFPEPALKDAFMRGFEFILEAQYPNGGWPQFYPPRPPKGHYSKDITYNDGAIVNVMHILKDISDDKKIFRPLALSDADKARARAAFDKGVENILDCQIRDAEGHPTVWCAQHDCETLVPSKARAYELPSFSGQESAGIVALLMDIPSPSPRVVEAVKGAMNWFAEHRIKDTDYVHYFDDNGEPEARLEYRPGHTIWARFYDLDTCEPFFCDRDGIKKASIYDIGRERRGGYSWYTEEPASLFMRYPEWIAALPD